MPLIREPYVYILASRPSGTLYVGVTSDLVKRIWEHRSDAVDGFTRRYGVHRLVYFELFRSMSEAIEREKELKKWRRAWKIALIEKQNPDWRDLWPEIIGQGAGYAGELDSGFDPSGRPGTTTQTKGRR